MSCSSALKFFITFLPQLVAERSVCFEVLLSLLPEGPPSGQPPYQNPLFDEDPLNDYAENLVVMEHVAHALRSVVAELRENNALSLKHYNSLSEKLPAQFHTKASPSQWESKHLFLSKRKAEVLSPLVKAISEVVHCNSSDLEDRTRHLQL